jgi:hypothetical protein
MSVDEYIICGSKGSVEHVTVEALQQVWFDITENCLNKYTYKYLNLNQLLLLYTFHK